MDRSDPIYPEYQQTPNAFINPQGSEHGTTIPDLTIGPKEGDYSLDGTRQYGTPVPESEGNSTSNEAVKEPAVADPDTIAPERTQVRLPSPATTAGIGKTAGHETVDVPEPPVTLPTPILAVAQNLPEGHSQNDTPEPSPAHQEIPDNTSEPRGLETPTSDSQGLLPSDANMRNFDLTVPQSDVPRLSLGGDAEKALERTPDEIATNEIRREQVTSAAKETARPYERAFREIVPDEQRKFLGIKRGGSVERQFERNVHGRTVSYQVSASFVPHGETNDLTRTDVKISRPDIPKKESPSLSFEFGSTGLETATLEVPYHTSRDPLKLISSLPGGQALSEQLELFVRSTDRFSPTQGFTVRLTAKPDQISYQLRRARTLHSMGDAAESRAGYRHTSWIYNPTTDAFEKFNNGWNKYDFQPLNNRLIDGRGNNSGALSNVTREEFFGQLRAMLGLLPTQEQPNL